MDEKKTCCCRSETEAAPECGCRTKHRSEKEYKDLIHRLNRVEGQIRGIRAMVEEERYCVDILTQVSAVKSALDSFNKVLLTQHIQTCVVEKIQDGDEAVIDELGEIVRKLLR